ncbi:MAG: hypothetical protein JXO44_05945, partial [Clostridia bacterium]|nr:hypothetical protein [Clostridia bacterium]
IPSYDDLYSGLEAQDEVNRIESMIVDYYSVENGRQINLNSLSEEEKMYYFSRSAKHNIILKMDR